MQYCVRWLGTINSLAPGVFQWNFGSAIFKLNLYINKYIMGRNGHLFYVGGDLMMRRGRLPIIMLPDGDLRIVLHLVPFWILTIWGSVHINLVIDSYGIFCKIALRWMLLYLTYDSSTLVQVMAWCSQATGHYLNQCWPKYVSSYSVIRPQWVKILLTTIYSAHLFYFIWSWCVTESAIELYGLGGQLLSIENTINDITWH